MKKITFNKEDEIENKLWYGLGDELWLELALELRNKLWYELREELYWDLELPIIIISS